MLSKRKPSRADNLQIYCMPLRHLDQAKISTPHFGCMHYLPRLMSNSNGNAPKMFRNASYGSLCP